jgi:chemotaxis protein CheX
MRLSSILDLRAAGPLKAEFTSVRGARLEVDASDVERLGGLCLQVIIAAAAAWREDGAEFRIVNPSPAFLESLKILGADALVVGA